jgi:hypothetical protein
LVPAGRQVQRLHPWEAPEEILFLTPRLLLVVAVVDMALRRRQVGLREALVVALGIPTEVLAEQEIPLVHFPRKVMMVGKRFLIPTMTAAVVAEQVHPEEKVEQTTALIAVAWECTLIFLERFPITQVVVV